MLPQLNTIWFASQLFWLVVLFSGFALLSFKFIVPVIEKYHRDRDLIVKKILSGAADIIAKAEQIKISNENKIRLAKEQANIILHKVKIECDNSNSSFNQSAINEIDQYKLQKAEELNKELLKRQIYFLKNASFFSEAFAKKAGITDFILNNKSFSAIQNNLEV